MEAKKRTGGFTLIELIVVIAILGILAGVGTVAYTGYVKAAHKGVDEQLISDVAYSMYLASYADPNFLEGNAYVVGLKYDDNPELKVVGVDGENTTGESKLKNALEMSFGSNCTENGALELTYDGWKLGAVTGLLRYGNSGYSGNEESLLTDIQTFTNALNDFLGGNKLENVLNATNSDYADYLKKMNVSNSQEAANATTLYLAQYAADKSNPDEYAAWWGSGFDPEFTPSELRAAADSFNHPDEFNAYDATGDLMVFSGAQVAAAEAMYQYMVKKGVADNSLKEKLNAIQNATGLTALSNAVTEFNNTVKDSNGKYYSTYQEWCRDQSATDAESYINCLKAINESADEFSGNLSNSSGNLYTDGKAYSLMTSYVSTAQAVEAAGLSSDSRAVAITVCKSASGNIMVTIYKNGEVIGDTITVKADEGEIDFDNTDNLASIGNHSYTMSVGETKMIQLKLSVDTLNEKSGSDFDVYTWVTGARNEGFLGDGFVSDNSSVVAVTTEYAPSGNNIVIVTLTVRAIGAGSATVTGDIYEGGYTFTVQ